MASAFVRTGHRLVFRHQRKEEDYSRRPGWLAQLRPAHTAVGHRSFEERIGLGDFVDLLQPD
jgi:hypothetical protein